MFLLFLISILISPSSATAGPPGSRVPREQQFLLRSVEELNRWREYVNATAVELERQIDAAAWTGSDRRKQDLSALLAWYRDYSDWVGDMIADRETDLDRSYSGTNDSGAWTGRYGTIAEGCVRLRRELSGEIRRLEQAGKEAADSMAALSLILQEHEQYEEDLKNPDKKQQSRDSRGRDDRRGYREMSDAEVHEMLLEIDGLAAFRRHLAVLINLAGLETEWLSLKADDSAALDNLANAIAGDEPSRAEDAVNRSIKTYEADIAELSRRADALDRAPGSFAGIGTMNSLDRMQDIAAYYENTKFRYRRHIDWLKEQIGAFRADLAELAKAR